MKSQPPLAQRRFADAAAKEQLMHPASLHTLPMMHPQCGGFCIAAPRADASACVAMGFPRLSPRRPTTPDDPVLARSAGADTRGAAFRGLVPRSSIRDTQRRRLHPQTARQMRRRYFRRPDRPPNAASRIDNGPGSGTIARLKKIPVPGVPESQNSPLSVVQLGFVTVRSVPGPAAL